MRVNLAYREEVKVNHVIMKKLESLMARRMRLTSEKILTIGKELLEHKSMINKSKLAEKRR